MGNEDVASAKPQYFANGDFEKTVADIISSPRRLKSYGGAPDETLFEINDKQKDYYTRCFRYLLKSTQNIVTPALDAALNGGDNKIVDFFKKSGLDTESLSRIWSLADVNEDGWLDINEFSTAMHLIVLRVKGELAIPSALPERFRPPFTPARPNPLMQGQISPATHASALSSGGSGSSLAGGFSSTLAPSSAVVTSAPSIVTSGAAHSHPSLFSLPQHDNLASKKSWDTFDVTDGPTSSKPASSPAVEPDQPLVTHFSDVPPLLVDNRPMALKQAVQLSSLKSPMGPPPQPPPRPTNRGHGRSASLDLKTLQTPFTSFAVPERRDSDSSALAAKQNALAPPPISARPRVATTTGVNATTPSLSQPLSVVPPPLPQRISPPTPTPNSTQASAPSSSSNSSTTAALSQQTSPKLPLPPSPKSSNVGIAPPPQQISPQLPTTASASLSPRVVAGNNMSGFQMSSYVVSSMPVSVSTATSATYPPAQVPIPPKRYANQETQTEGRFINQDELEKYLSEFDGRLKDLLGDEIQHSQGVGVDRWANRCEGLRRQNKELEMERARLAQVRIQLELRLQELEEHSTHPTCSASKPTSL